MTTSGTAIPSVQNKEPHEERLRSFAPILQHRIQSTQMISGRTRQKLTKLGPCKGTCKSNHRSQAPQCGQAAHAPGWLPFTHPAPTRTPVLRHGAAPAVATTAPQLASPALHRTELPSLFSLHYSRSKACSVLRGVPSFATCFQSQMYSVVWSPTPRSHADPLLRIRLLVLLNLNTTTELEREALLRGKHRHWANEP